MKVWCTALTGVALLLAISSVQRLAYAADRGVPSVQMAQNTRVDTGTASELLLMLEQSRAEISELRGQVESLTWKLDQLEKQGRDRYEDLDRRLLELQGGTQSRGQGDASRSAPGDRSSGGQAATGGSSGQSTSEPQLEAATESQIREYEAAYQLIKDRNYEQAIRTLKGFVSTNQRNELTPNAWYWLGEVYLVLPDLAQARSAFLNVVSDFSGHRKAPDAFYKLGVTYDRLGDTGKAKSVLADTVARFPDTPAARLAQDYLEKL